MDAVESVEQVYCRKCEQSLPDDAFYPSCLVANNGNRRTRSICKLCMTKHLDRESARQNVRNWYARHPEAVEAKKRQSQERRDEERQADPIAYARSRFDEILRRKYGISLIEWERLFAAQGNRCACCRRSESGFVNRGGVYPGWHTDHCHITGVVRGILCGHCNLGIGHFFDNPDLVEDAARYLRPVSGVDEHY